MREKSTAAFLNSVECDETGGIVDAAFVGVRRRPDLQHSSLSREPVRL